MRGIEYRQACKQANGEDEKDEEDYGRKGEEERTEK